MFFKKEIQLPEVPLEIDHDMVEQIKRMIWTVDNIKKVNRYSGLSIRCQGRHPITGGTSVVYLKEEITTTTGMKSLLTDLLSGESGFYLNDFKRRVNEKVVDAYSVKLEVSGEDSDGDSLDYEIKFSSQEQLLNLIDNGVRSIGCADNHQFKLLE